MLSLSLRACSDLVPLFNLSQYQQNGHRVELHGLELT
jgi:hypothetical protein